MTAGHGLVSAPPPPTTECASLTTDNAPVRYLESNRGANGATTADWISPSSGQLLGNAIAAWAPFGVTAVSIMLGANDANLQNVDAATYQSNMQSIIDNLKTAGITKIVLNQPLYIQTVTNPTANTLLLAYQTSIASLVAADPTVVFQGDTSGYATFQANPSYYQSDGLHPNDTGAAVLAGLWEAVYPV